MSKQSFKKYTNMKQLVILFVPLFLIFSCKKENVTPTDSPPTPAPEVIIKYNLIQKTAMFLNGDTSMKVLGWVGSGFKYGIPGDPRGFECMLMLHDSGTVLWDSMKYAWLKYQTDFDGDHLFFKANWGYDDITVSPHVLTDTTKTFLVIHKKTGRSMEISADSFRRQGKLIFYYEPK